MNWWSKAPNVPVNQYQRKVIEKLTRLLEVAMATQDQIDAIAGNFKQFVADVQRVLNDVIANNGQNLDISALQGVSDNASTLETQLDSFDPEPSPPPAS